MKAITLRPSHFALSPLRFALRLSRWAPAAGRLRIFSALTVTHPARAPVVNPAFRLPLSGMPERFLFPFTRRPLRLPLCLSPLLGVGRWTLSVTHPAREPVVKPAFRLPLSGMAERFLFPFTLLCAP